MDILSPIFGLILLCQSNPDECLVLEQGNTIFIGACLDPNKEYELNIDENIKIPDNSKFNIIINTKCTNV